ncbi:hypothetical protein [Neobacillus sp.]|uniref:hypothetical protein n=1 Tax=Neobacillus sp. TaxID=2675273 RepID=UPI00289DF0BA|nr:hypothetical protein [Neobacillus sp.]
MRKITALLLTLVLGLGIVFLNPSSSSAAENKIVQSGKIDLSNLTELKNSEGVTIKEVTYEEMIDAISITDGITKEKARELHPKKMEISYSTKTMAVAALPVIHEILIRQTVTSTYHPAVQVFVYTTGSGSFYNFTGIEQVGLNRKDISTTTSKQFSGTVRAVLQNSISFWWFIDGDFYNNGTTSGSFSAEANGGIWKGTASITQTSNHYKYWNKSGTYSIY